MTVRQPLDLQALDQAQGEAARAASELFAGLDALALAPAERRTLTPSREALTTALGSARDALAAVAAAPTVTR